MASYRLRGLRQSDCTNLLVVNHRVNIVGGAAGMFPSNKKSNGVLSNKRIDGAHNSSVTILTNGCHFSGKLYCRGSTRIGGRVEGEIISQGLLIIEEEAQIKADIRAEEAIVQGVLQGRLDAAGRVELCSTSIFTGDVATPTLVIHEGAQFNGSSRMTKESSIDQSGKGKTLDGKHLNQKSSRPIEGAEKLKKESQRVRKISSEPTVQG